MNKKDLMLSLEPTESHYGIRAYNRFETDMELNSKRKRDKYKELVDRLKKSYDDVVYANIFNGCLRFH